MNNIVESLRIGLEDMRLRLGTQMEMNEHLLSDNAELREEIERLREALKPFAAIEPLPCDSDKMEFELWFLIKSDRTIDRPMIKVSDLRAAKAALLLRADAECEQAALEGK